MGSSVAQLPASRSAEAEAQSLQHSALFCTGEASTATAEAQQNSEWAQDAPAQPAVDEAPPVDVSTPNPVAESAGFDLDILQQVADTVFESLEVFLPQEVADQLRGRSIIVLLALVAVAVVLLAGMFSITSKTPAVLIHVLWDTKHASLSVRRCPVVGCAVGMPQSCQARGTLQHTFTTCVVCAALPCRLPLSCGRSTCCTGWLADRLVFQTSQTLSNMAFAQLLHTQVH